MKKIVAVVLGLTASAALSGCATIFDGTSQEITVNTSPAGVVCVFERQGYEVGRVQNTPGTANIRKSKYDIIIRCDKPGFAEATYLNHSGTSATIAANIAADLVLTAGLSSIVDSADGADNKYDSAVNISMAPLTAVAYAQPGYGAPAYAPYGYAQPAQPAYAPVDAAAPGLPCTREQIETARMARANGYRAQSGC